MFVVDDKFGADSCAAECRAAPDYTETVARTLKAVASSDRELWVRHLLMPGHIDCCTRPVIERITDLGRDVRFNVMPAFVSFDSRWGRLGKEELSLARALVEEAAPRIDGEAYWDGAPLS